MEYRTDEDEFSVEEREEEENGIMRSGFCGEGSYDSDGREKEEEEEEERERERDRQIKREKREEEDEEEEGIRIEKEEQKKIFGEIEKQLDQIHDWNVSRYPINPPPLYFQFEKNFNIWNYFPSPDGNELFELSRNERGRAKRLSQSQLDQVWRNGRFDVESIKYPGQIHVWELSNLFQKGTVECSASLHSGFAKAAKFFVIRIPDVLWRSNFFSVVKGVRICGECGHDFASAFVGTSWLLDPQDPEVTKNEFLRTTLYDEIEKVLKTNELYSGGSLLKDGAYSSVKGDDTDSPSRFLFLINQDSKLFQELAQKERSLEKSWARSKAARRRELAEKYSASEQSQQMSEALVLQAIADEEARMFADELTKIIESTISDPSEIQFLTCLMNNLAIVNRLVNEREKERITAWENQLNQLKENHSILSEISGWRYRQEAQFYARWDRLHPQDEFVRDALVKVDPEARWIFEKNLEIVHSDELTRVLREEKEKKRPYKTFSWSFRIWKPSNWEIKKENDYYFVNKYETVETTTTHPFWRMTNIGMRTSSYLKNGFFYVTANMIYGPYGTRSLCGLESFYPDKTVNQMTGELEPDKSYKVKPWFRKIMKLWHGIGASINEFERTPDRGLIGKSCTRVFNRLWNYLVMFCFGTLFLFFGHLFVALFQLMISVFLLFSLPLLGPLGAIMAYFCTIFIYDFDGNEPCFPIFFYLGKFLIVGIGQIILAPLIAFLFVFAGGLRFIWEFLCYSSRRFWDTFMYFVVVRFRARIPAADSFAARRISGPGIGMQFYYKIESELVLLLIQSALEKELMTRYRARMLSDIGKPLKRLTQYLDRFEVVGLSKSSNHFRIQSFQKTRSDLEKRLNEALEGWDKPVFSSHHHYSSRLKMTQSDLDSVLSEMPVICKQFYKERMLPYLEFPEDFWVEKEVEVHDWFGLSKWYFTQNFSEGILSPISEVDKEGFEFVVDHLEILKHFGDLLEGHSHRDDLAKVIPKLPRYSTKAIPSPSFEVVSPSGLHSHYNPPGSYVWVLYSPYREYIKEKERKAREERKKQEKKGQVVIPLDDSYPLLSSVEPYEEV